MRVNSGKKKDKRRSTSIIRAIKEGDLLENWRSVSTARKLGINDHIVAVVQVTLNCGCPVYSDNFPVLTVDGIVHRVG